MVGRVHRDKADSRGKEDEDVISSGTEYVVWDVILGMVRRVFVASFLKIFFHVE